MGDHINLCQFTTRSPMWEFMWKAMWIDMWAPTQQPTWVPMRGTIEWPAKSSDLTPLDFFFWGYIRNKIYVSKPGYSTDLRKRIVHKCADTSPEIIRSFIENFYVHLEICLKIYGGHFEHEL
ncbi:hypothetical protein TKK_0015421 [Trichogramma kaykai]